MKMRIYTEEMVDFLNSNVDKYSWSQLTKLFNQNFECEKNVKNIIRLCSRNEIVKRQMPAGEVKYTEAMVEFLRSNVDKYSWEKLTKLFNLNFNCNKSAKNIMRLCSRNKIQKRPRMKKYIKIKRQISLYTEEMLEFLRTNSMNISYKELTRLFNEKFGLNKHVYDIRYHCLKNGIKKTGGLSGEMIDFLRANFENYNLENLAIRFNSRFDLNKKKHDMNNYCTKYGLRKSNTYSIHPYTLPIGSERQRVGMGGWIYVKVDHGKWKAKHHLVWEQAYGPIPEGHLVIFADGNTENFDIENLILVTRREFLCFSRNPLQLLHANEELRRIGINIAKITIKIRHYNEKQSNRGDAP